MGSITLFLPALFSLLAMLLLLRYGVDKSGLIIGAMTAMVAFLLTKESMNVASAVNTIALGFLLAYLIVFLVHKRKGK